MMVAVVVPVVTVLTIVIPLVADANTRITSVDTLAIDAGPAGDEAQPVDEAEPEVVLAASSTVGLGSEEVVNAAGRDLTWRVRWDAPFETIPLCAYSDACVAEQTAWLDTWGRPVGDDIWNGYLTLSNTATDGSSMSVRDIHSVGTFIRPEVPEVTVTLRGGEGDGSQLVVMQQTLGSTDPATFSGTYFGAPDGSPAVINIAPGEFIQTLTYFTRSDGDEHADFTGSLVADVEVGGVSTPVVLFDGFTRVGPPQLSSTILRINGDFVACGVDGWDDCTIPLFVEQLRADPEFPG